MVAGFIPEQAAAAWVTMRLVAPFCSEYILSRRRMTEYSKSAPNTKNMQVIIQACERIKCKKECCFLRFWCNKSCVSSGFPAVLPTHRATGAPF